MLCLCVHFLWGFDLGCRSDRRSVVDESMRWLIDFSASFPCRVFAFGPHSCTHSSTTERSLTIELNECGAIRAHDRFMFGISWRTLFYLDK